MTPETASKTLLHRISKGEPEAFELVSKIYFPIVYRWAIAAGCSHSQADDVLQETFFTAFRSFEIDLVDRFRTYLWTVFRRRLADLYAKQGNQPVGRGGTTANRILQMVPEFEEDESESDQESTLVEVVLSLKNQFSTNVWTSFWRTTIHDDNPEDIAADLQISVWAVYKAKKRCQQRINEEFQRLGISGYEQLWQPVSK